MAHVEWTESESYRSNGKTETRRRTYSSHEQYLNSQTVLFGQISGETVVFPAGTHSYGFSCLLPYRLPGTLKTGEAEIKYKVKLVMDIPWGFDIKKSHYFTVVNVIDLNQNDSLRFPVKMEELKSFCTFSCGKQEAYLSASIAQGGFVPNEEIKVLCTINNKTNVPFEGVTFTLQRKITATVTMPMTKSRQNKTNVVERVYPIEPKTNTTTEITGVLTVPVCPVSSNFAAYIHTDYFVKAEFRVVGCHSNVTLRLPVQIGTMPLSSAPSLINQVPLAPMPAVQLSQLPTAPPDNSGEKEAIDRK